MDLFPHSGSKLQKTYLVLDMEEDERLFKESIKEFQASIKCANFPERKKEEHLQSKSELAVELIEARTSSHDDLAIKPKEPNMSEQCFDPLEGILDTINDAKAVPTETETDKVVAVKSDISLPWDDEQTEATEATEATKAIEDDPKDVSPVEACKKVANKPDTEEQVTSKNDDPDPEKSIPKVLVGLDMEGFMEVVAHAKKDLESVDRTVQLDILEKQLEEYVVTLGLDHETDRLKVLGDKMAQIQAMIDSVTTPLGRLTSWAAATDKAWRYIESVGVLFSSASSREKREGQVKLVMRDLWLEHTKVNRLKDLYKDALDALKGQWDTVSRLITHDLAVQKTIRGISAGELSTEEKDAIAEEVNTQISEAMRIQPKSEPQEEETDEPQEEETTSVDEDDGNVSEIDSTILDGLEAFPGNAEEIIKSKNKATKGEIDWDF